MERSTLGRINVQEPIKRAFRAYLNADATASGGAETKLSATTENFDYGSVYDISTSIFYPSVAGIYHVSGNINFVGGISSGKQGYMRLYKNGAGDVFGPISNTGTATGLGVAISVLVELTATNYLEAYWQLTGTATNLIIDGDTTVTYWSAVRVA